MLESPKNQRALGYLTIAVGVMLLLPLFFLAHGCDDDIAISVARSVQNGYFKAAWNAAVGWGRFYEVIAYNMAQIPFLSQKLVVTNAFRFLATGLTLLAFWAFVSAAMESKVKGCLALVITAAVFYTGPNYNPYHCYPLWFQPPMALSMLSWWLFITGLQRGRPKRIWASGIALFLSMCFYEPFLLFSAGHVLIYLWFRYRKGMFEIKREWKPALKFAVPAIMASIVYVIVFLGFQKIYPSGYGGSTLSITDPLTILGVTAKLSEPTVQFSGKLIKQAFQQFPRFSNLLPMVYVVTFMSLCGLTTFLALRSSGPKLRSQKGLIWALIFSIAFIFIPNSLYGLSKQYRDFAGKPDCCSPYIGTYYGTFFLGLSIALVALLMISRGPAPVQKVLRVILSLFVALYAFVSSVRTMGYASDWQRSQRLWSLADYYVDQTLEEKKALPSDILAPRLWQSFGVTIPDDYNYWTHYYSLRADQPTNVHRYPDKVAGLLVEGKGVRYLTGQLTPRAKSPVIVQGSLVATPDLVQELTLQSRDGLSHQHVEIKLTEVPERGAVTCGSRTIEIKGDTLHLLPSPLAPHELVTCVSRGSSRFRLETFRIEE